MESTNNVSNPGTNNDGGQANLGLIIGISVVVLLIIWSALALVYLKYKEEKMRASRQALSRNNLIGMAETLQGNPARSISPTKPASSGNTERVGKVESAVPKAAVEKPEIRVKMDWLENNNEANKSYSSLNAAKLNVKPGDKLISNSNVLAHSAQKDLSKGRSKKLQNVAIRFVNDGSKESNVTTSSNTHSSFRLKASEDGTTTMSLSKSRIDKVVSVPGYRQLDLMSDLNFSTDQKLGEGGTATTYKCTFSKGTLISEFQFHEVAVKVLKDTDEEAINSMKYEVAIMSHIPPCKNIVQFVGYCEDPLAIVMRYYSTSLKKVIEEFDILHDQPELARDISVKICYDIANGMNHLHTNGILHLDLKPHNILVDFMEGDDDHCVICDFGFANFTKASGKNIVRGLPIDKSVGVTPRYASPELLERRSQMSHRFNEELDKKIDVYAYGCILYEVFAREKMWNGYKLGEIVAAVRNGVRPALGSRFESAPPLLVDIMKRCWRQKPADRPSFLEIKHIITNAFIDGASSNSNTNSKSNTLAEFTSDFSHTI